ncbi:unnamed protein product [Prorocentrum cordatum]|uniref:C3H1-type domain-containing protein n=1 Tax=Prorocentrum cordatum TaxID=2364126 RepID=A0ABN9WLR9_9DINO|nr:unnamed protein product [Polarella glacialis]
MYSSSLVSQVGFKQAAGTPIVGSLKSRAAALGIIPEGSFASRGSAEEAGAGPSSQPSWPPAEPAAAWREHEDVGPAAVADPYGDPDDFWPEMPDALDEAERPGPAAGTPGGAGGAPPWRQAPSQQASSLRPPPAGSRLLSLRPSGLTPRTPGAGQAQPAPPALGAPRPSTACGSRGWASRALGRPALVPRVKEELAAPARWSSAPSAPVKAELNVKSERPLKNWEVDRDKKRKEALKRDTACKAICVIKHGLRQPEAQAMQLDGKGYIPDNWDADFKEHLGSYVKFLLTRPDQFKVTEGSGPGLFTVENVAGNDTVPPEKVPAWGSWRKGGKAPGVKTEDGGKGGKSGPKGPACGKGRGKDKEKSKYPYDVCWQWIGGHCRDGDSCRWKHYPLVGSEEPAAPQPRPPATPPPGRPQGQPMGLLRPKFGGPRPPPFAPPGKGGSKGPAGCGAWGKDARPVHPQPGPQAWGDDEGCEVSGLDSHEAEPDDADFLGVQADDEPTEAHGEDDAWGLLGGEGKRPAYAGGDEAFSAKRARMAW